MKSAARPQPSRNRSSSMSSGTSKGLMRTKFVISLCSFPSDLLPSVVRKYRRSEGRILLHSCGFRYIFALFGESRHQKALSQGLRGDPEQALGVLREVALVGETYR